MGTKTLGIGVRYTVYNCSAALKGYLTGLGSHSVLGTNWLEWDIFFVYNCSAAVKGYLTALGSHSRLRDKLVGVRLRYMFSCVQL